MLIFCFFLQLTLVLINFVLILIFQLTKSDGTQVTLRAVNRVLTGNYQCEVSEDAPLFHTELRTAHMQVIELPKTEPMMFVDKKMISFNDQFKAECSVGESFPPANITWYINGRKVSFSCPGVTFTT